MGGNPVCPQGADRPVPSVLVEVVLAEVTLSDLEGSGFDFVLKAALDRYGVTAGTRGALGVKSSGLSATFRSGEQTRAMLGIFYEDSRVVIRSPSAHTRQERPDGEHRGRQRDPRHYANR